MKCRNTAYTPHCVYAEVCGSLWSCCLSANIIGLSHTIFPMCAKRLHKGGMKLRCWLVCQMRACQETMCFLNINTIANCATKNTMGWQFFEHGCGHVKTRLSTAWWIIFPFGTGRAHIWKQSQKSMTWWLGINIRPCFKWARAYYEAHYSKERFFDVLESELKQLKEQHHGARA